MNVYYGGYIGFKISVTSGLSDGLSVKYRFLPYSSLMMEAARTSETSVDNYFTRQYIPEDNSELHTRGRENLKSHIDFTCLVRECFPTFGREINSLS
jgi:hypothetical protein